MFGSRNRCQIYETFVSGCILTVAIRNKGFRNLPLYSCRIPRAVLLLNCGETMVLSVSGDDVACCVVAGCGNLICVFTGSCGKVRDNNDGITFVVVVVVVVVVGADIGWCESSSMACGLLLIMIMFSLQILNILHYFPQNQENVLYSEKHQKILK
ncbi:hypothetical protein FF38_05456 [Lucilia cuprina]|uniref:Uncharacterized protein n=1 Tax=Lucilia cuprina TaxID=7375 RepID=A0A0L0CI95_LUCCU|nr:hypothetical protein FF38_05456 [Lucilia cuprina]